MAASVRGLRQVLRNIDRASKGLDDAGVKGARDAAEEIADRAKNRTPVRTGRLRSSLRVVRSDGGAEVTTDVRYAPYQEFGTSRGVAARNYLRSAIRDSRSSVIDMFTRSFQQVTRRGR